MRDFNAMRALPPRRPSAGDAVRLTAEWPWASNMIKVGAIGIINGIADVGLDPSNGMCVCWNHSTFRGPSSRFSKDPTVCVSSSGGPATIMLPAGLLVSTGEIITVNFWRWRDLPCAGGGVPYTADVPVWEWDGKGY